MSKAHPVDLRFEDVSRHFRGPDTSFALRDIRLTIGAGETVLMVGPSGSGKTTLMHLAAGLDRPTKGRVLVGRKCISEMGEGARATWRGQTIGFVFQHHFLPGGWRCVDVVAAPLIWSQGMDATKARRKAGEWLDRVGLEDQARQRVECLSGGQRQRVAVARALVTEPALILADEPTAQLDHDSAEMVIGLLCDHTAESGATMVIVSHEDQPGDWRADRHVVLLEGRIIAEVPAEE